VAYEGRGLSSGLLPASARNAIARSSSYAQRIGKGSLGARVRASRAVGRHRAYLSKALLWSAICESARLGEHVIDIAAGGRCMNA